MITFKVAGQKYQFPTTWADVTHDQYVYHIIPRTMAETIHCFTKIPLEKLEHAEIKGLEKISLALAFMTISPKFSLTPMVGHYILPKDITFESLGQFEDLRGLMKRLPQKEMKLWEYADFQTYSDLCLEAAAIYCQKIRDGKYDYRKVAEVKEELKLASCTQTIGAGAFFLGKPMNISPPTLTRFQKASQQMRRWIQALPGYQRTLDSLRPSSGYRGK